MEADEWRLGRRRGGWRVDGRGAAPDLDASLPRRKFVWILLHASTRRALNVQVGAALRIYDPFVAPSATVPLVDDPTNVADTTILDAQLCEREPTGDLDDPPPLPEGVPAATAQTTRG